MDAEQDPVRRLVGELEAMALRLRDRVRDRTLPRELRSAIRRLLAEVFRAVGEAPEPGERGRLEWTREARPLLARGREIDEEIARFESPPPPFYERGRLGVIRVVEPVRIRFAVGRLGRVENFGRFVMLERLVDRIDWLWDRLRQARPDLFEAEEEEKPIKVFRDENELVWGRVTR